MTTSRGALPALRVRSAHDSNLTLRDQATERARTSRFCSAAGGDLAELSDAEAADLDVLEPGGEQCLAAVDLVLRHLSTGAHGDNRRVRVPAPGEDPEEAYKEYGAPVHATAADGVHGNRPAKAMLHLARARQMASAGQGTMRSALQRMNRGDVGARINGAAGMLRRGRLMLWNPEPGRPFQPRERRHSALGHLYQAYCLIRDYEVNPYALLTSAQGDVNWWRVAEDDWARAVMGTAVMQPNRLGMSRKAFEAYRNATAVPRTAWPLRANANSWRQASYSNVSDQGARDAVAVVSYARDAGLLHTRGTSDDISLRCRPTLPESSAIRKQYGPRQELTDMARALLDVHAHMPPDAGRLTLTEPTRGSDHVRPQRVPDYCKSLSEDYVKHPSNVAGKWPTIFAPPGGVVAHVPDAQLPQGTQAALAVVPTSSRLSMQHGPAPRARNTPLQYGGLAATYSGVAMPLTTLVDAARRVAYGSHGVLSGCWDARTSVFMLVSRTAALERHAHAHALAQGAAQSAVGREPVEWTDGARLADAGNASQPMPRIDSALQAVTDGVVPSRGAATVRDAVGPTNAAPRGAGAVAAAQRPMSTPDVRPATVYPFGGSVPTPLPGAVADYLRSDSGASELKRMLEHASFILGMGNQYARNDRLRNLMRGHSFTGDFAVRESDGAALHTPGYNALDAEGKKYAGPLSLDPAFCATPLHDPLLRNGYPHNMPAHFLLHNVWVHRRNSDLELYMAPSAA